MWFQDIENICDEFLRIALFIACQENDRKNQNSRKAAKVKKYSKSCKVEKILKGSLDWIPSPSPLVKIQIMDVKVCSAWGAKA